HQQLERKAFHGQLIQETMKELQDPLLRHRVHDSIRMRTADHLPRSWPFERSHYAGTFRTPQYAYSRHSVPTPIEVHRRNNPHPRLTDPYQYPDKTYIVWKNNLSTEPPREVKSEPINILQNNKHRWFSTTYKSTFDGKPLVHQSYKRNNPWKPERFRSDPK
ncbi:hypothetical protein QZH41_009163, partial [Actinostola sp. cb2023]